MKSLSQLFTLVLMVVISTTMLIGEQHTVGVDALQTCAIGRISLLALPTMTFEVGSTVYTMGYCHAVNSPTSGVTQCASTGFIQAHNTVNQACLASYSVVTTGLTVMSSNTGVYFTVQTADATQVANVTINCDRNAASGTASLVTPLSVNTVSGVTTSQLAVTSLAGCNIDTFFCSNSVACADTSKTCIEGVCFDTNCARVATVKQSTKLPANFVSEISVEDCHGTPLANLTNTSFKVTLDGSSLDSTALKDEVTHIIGPAPELAVPLLTTLVLDQSRSVINNGQAVLLEAARTFVNIVTSPTSVNHYVAIIAFDGSTNPVVVQTHTNSQTTLLAALNGVWPPSGLTDPDSTDLYNAVIDGLNEAYRMTFSFGKTDVPITSSMILFTDGYDTSRRTTSSAAVIHAAKMASKVKIMAVGIDNTSDTTFLRSVATSGFYEFVSLDNLVQTFSDAALKLVALTSNNYYVLLCVPMRRASIPLTITLDNVQFPSVNTLSYAINGTGFTGGCNTASLNTEVQTRSDAAVSNVLELTAGGALTDMIPSGGAFFFHFTFTNALEVSCSLSTVEMVYVRNSRCRLSKYCQDGTATGSFTASANTRYDVMIRNTDEVNAITVTVATEASTPAPLPTSPGATGVPPGTRAPAGTTINLTALSDFAGPGDVDEAAAWIFFVFGMIFFVGFFLAALYVRSTQTKSISRAEKKRRMSPRTKARALEQEQHLLEAPVYSAEQPYRGSQLHPTPSPSRSFGNPNVSIYGNSSHNGSVNNGSFTQQHRARGSFPPNGLNTPYRGGGGGVGAGVSGGSSRLAGRDMDSGFYRPPQSIDGTTLLDDGERYEMTDARNIAPLTYHNL